MAQLYSFLTMFHSKGKAVFHSKAQLYSIQSHASCIWPFIYISWQVLPVNLFCDEGGGSFVVYKGQRLYDPSDHLFKRLLSALFLINYCFDPPAFYNLVSCLDLFELSQSRQSEIISLGNAEITFEHFMTSRQEKSRTNG